MHISLRVSLADDLGLDETALEVGVDGFAIATWCYTQGAYVAQYLTFNQMLINIFSFNIIWVFIECLPILLTASSITARY